MTQSEKCQKLLAYSVILKADDKKSWQELLPKMSETQVQTLYNGLVEEVKAWKKEGISIVSDLALEMQLLPQQDHGTSINDLKSRLEGGGTKPPLVVPKPPKPTPVPPVAEVEEAPEVDLTQLGPIMPPVVTRAPEVIRADAKAKPVPKIRNRVAKSGLKELKEIRTIDDLSKIEPAHLRQGPLQEQIKFIKQRISQLSQENNLLPVNVIPIFEQSALIQTYLKTGSLMIEKNIGDDKYGMDHILNDLENMGMDGLTKEEFESVADLKKELEAMAGL